MPEIPDSTAANEAPPQQALRAIAQDLQDAAERLDALASHYPVREWVTIVRSAGRVLGDLAEERGTD